MKFVASFFFALSVCSDIRKVEPDIRKRGILIRTFHVLLEQVSYKLENRPWQKRIVPVHRTFTKRSALY